jgi:crotonobetaine/carnitine-CoA ligase
MTSTSTSALEVRTGSLTELLSARAQSSPKKTFLWTPDEVVSYAEADERVERLAAGLQAQGVGTGDRVMLLMSNSASQVLLWLATERIGAVNVPINTALSPDLLSRAIRTVQPSLIATEPDYSAILRVSLPEAQLEHVPVYVDMRGRADGERVAIPGARDVAALESRDPARRPDIDDLSPAVILFTSGSTGVPKACVLSRRYVVRAGQIHAKYLRFTEQDVLFTPFPLFHIDAATLTVGAALAVGATAALTKRFSASRFWREVRASEATVFNFMGATANILWKQPPTDCDRSHRVRLAWGVPMPACEPNWSARFGFPLVEVYGLTDAGVPAYQPLDEPRVPGSCGRVIPEYEVRIGGKSDELLPAGTVGEILIRGNEPGIVMSEYFGMPDATAHAFRGGWFHTGDFAHIDDDENLFFASRSKEVIRRRGENIAATDVERGVDACAAVRESAAVGVPSELTEEDIKIFVAPQPGSHVTPAEILEHCRQTLPRYMVPRYVEIMTDLPKTPTEKIERAKLAALPITPATWDADAGGFHNDPKNRTRP